MDDPTTTAGRPIPGAPAGGDAQTPVKGPFIPSAPNRLVRHTILNRCTQR